MTSSVNHGLDDEVSCYFPGGRVPTLELLAVSEDRLSAELACASGGRVCASIKIGSTPLRAAL